MTTLRDGFKIIIEHMPVFMIPKLVKLRYTQKPTFQVVWVYFVRFNKVQSHGHKNI